MAAEYTVRVDTFPIDVAVDLHGLAKVANYQLARCSPKFAGGALVEDIAGRISRCHRVVITAARRSNIVDYSSLEETVIGSDAFRRAVDRQSGSV
jgi:hypothetical protein